VIWRLALLLLAFAGLMQPAAAHEVRPGYLEIREVEAGSFDILWKTPAKGDMRLALDVILPETCESVTSPRTVLSGGAVIARWRESCAGGLSGQEIGVAGLSQTLTDVVVQFEPAEGHARALVLTPDEPRAVIPQQASWTDVMRDYAAMGFQHILEGIDHLAFVLALMLLVRKLGRLAGAVTAFTVAHSLTLAATTFGWIRLGSAPVEASIALSIAFVAAEILRVRQGKDSITARWPWTASFAFGLLHGFGFAGALREIGVPEDAAPLALLSFNLGVEAGQLAFIFAMSLLWFVIRKLPVAKPAWAAVAPAYAIGIAACFWFIERALPIVTGVA
jgi:hypothetical protein